jgi:hypothetical protein
MFGLKDSKSNVYIKKIQNKVGKCDTGKCDSGKFDSGNCDSGKSRGTGYWVEN